jgi:hypothetical protein
MTGFPWFPIGHATARGTVGRLREEGPGYQVLQDQASDRLILVLAADSKAGDGVLASTLVSEFAGIEFGGRSFLALSTSRTDDGAGAAMVEAVRSTDFSQRESAGRGDRRSGPARFGIRSPLKPDAPKERTACTPLTASTHLPRL